MFGIPFITNGLRLKLIPMHVPSTFMTFYGTPNLNKIGTTKKKGTHVNVNCGTKGGGGRAQQ